MEFFNKHASSVSISSLVENIYKWFSNHGKKELSILPKRGKFVSSLVLVRGGIGTKLNLLKSQKTLVPVRPFSAFSKLRCRTTGSLRLCPWHKSWHYIQNDSIYKLSEMALEENNSYCKDLDLMPSGARTLAELNFLMGHIFPTNANVTTLDIWNTLKRFHFFDKFESNIFAFFSYVISGIEIGIGTTRTKDQSSSNMIGFQK